MQISRQPTEENYANRSAWYKNINSTQNKFDELTDMIKTRKAHIAIVSDTEIDSTYPNDQFSLPGYLLYIVMIEEKLVGASWFLSLLLFHVRD